MSAADEVVGDDEGGDEGSDDKGGGGDESGDGVVEEGEGGVDDAEQVAPGKPGGHHRLLTGEPPKQSGKPPCRK